MNETNGPDSSGTGIAIVGMAGRFPGAADLERFWENLAAGVESVTFFRREELLAAGVDPALLDDPAYVPARAVVDGAELFDAELFGYSPREAEVMDPQHRLLLECAWEALDHAGYDPRRYDGLIGVYAGAGPNTYLLFNLAANRELLNGIGQFQTMLGNGGDFLTSRLSYKLGLRGPSLTVQTACSTSLVAVHLAVQSLLNGECDLALAGGVRISVPRPAGYLYQVDAVLSPDGHCRPFDAAAQGPVDGEGAGIVVLKRLADALDDGDHIHAVILGTAVNNDGAVRVGYTAPGVEGQAAVVAMAQAVAAVHPETIGFLEGHGTATPLGDPVEVSALRQVFAASTSRKGFCALGSVKGNIGHLDAAAGVASLIKAVLALERGAIPPTLHFQRPNPRLDLENSPFFVNAAPVAWPSGQHPRRAGVSAFGMGGTNAHAVLEEAPPISPASPGSPSQPWQLLVLSAASEPALETMTDRLADHLARHSGLDLADVAFTLQVGRQELPHRRMLVCRCLAEAREALVSRDPRRVFSAVVDDDGETVVPDGEGSELLEALGRRWLAGAQVDWQALHPGKRRLRVPLPAYPFQRQAYWIGAPPSAVIGANAASTASTAQQPAPATRQPRPATGAPFVPPHGELEERLAALFEDLLGIAPVGAADNFFTLGGHSLLGLQLLSRVKSDLGVEVRLEWLFKAASVADLAGLIAVLEEERAGTAEDGRDGIPRVSRDGDLPLSYAQERLWFLDRLDPGTPAFNLTESVRLRGTLDVPALGRALAEVVRRHESLRTAFVDRQGRPVQTILPQLEVRLPLIDLSGLPQERRQAEAERLAVRAGERRFDLSRPPLLAAELYRLAPDCHAMVLVYHHIIGDGWSSTVLLSDLTQIYGAFAAGEPSPLAELPVQYADFAQWQRGRLGEKEIAEQLAGWRERLAPPLPVLDLPTDRPRPAVQSFRGMSEVLMLPPELAASLHGLGAAEGATPFMVLLAGFAAVLSRWSGQEDLIVGSPVAGRDRLELERMIGIFLNMLPLRIDLSGAPSFRGLLGRVRETALAAYTRKEVPVERILEEVQPGRDLSRSPLFQVLFNFLAFPHPSLEVPGLAIEAFPIREAPSRFDFTIYAEELPSGETALDLVYNADLFDRATMAGFLTQLRRVFEQGAAEPDTLVSQISLVTPEAAAVLPDPRVPLAAGDWKGAVHERFAERARLAPDRPAVIDAQGTWTYGGLAARAGELAQRLRALGIERGDIVAILAERSAPLVQSLLAVLETGAAFLVLDPAHPETRRQAVLRQAAPRARIEIAGGLLNVYAETGPTRVPRPDGFAYVAFTSGSTGEPKGVLGTHGPLAHFCQWHARTFGLSGDDRFSLLSGLSHDPLLRDVFTPLSLGATLCIPSPDELASPAGWLARQAITVCHLTPALGQVVAAGGTLLPHLRWAFFGGDILTERDVGRLRARAPKVSCVNFYGTTETPQAMAWHDASGAGDWPARRVPAGRGIEGVQILVLNEAGDLAAPAELGEVCVRTRHLSVGYLGDERLTAERFVANPFAADGADRIYRTGDLGRYRFDGAVDLAGRRDRQIQVRGFRVEPAEVEGALALHPAVREGVVLSRHGILTAWLAAAPAVARPAAAEMRDFLRRLLPEPMVPEAFVWLERLPLTPNGKLDRAALPDPEPVRAAPGSAGSAAPLTSVEISLASIWREVLGLEELGLEDNFFDLGGHSLLATQVASRLHETFGIDLPIRTLFEVPTLGGLAARIETLRGPCETVQSEPPPLLAPGRQHTGEIPLSFAQERLWFLAQLAPQSPAYNMPFAVQLAGTLDRPALAAALSEIRRRHETLRTTFRIGAAGRPVQVVQPAAPLALPLLDLSSLPAASRSGEARRVAGETALTPFDLAGGPLVRTLLFRLAPDDHVVLWVTHHVAADGWSLMAVFLPELGALYTAFSQGLPSPLPEPPVQYADFALWQRSWLHGEKLEKQTEYWRRTLAGASTLELPVDRARRPVPSAHGASRSWTLPEAQTEGLRDLALAEGASLFMAVHAAFAVLLQRYTGQDDVVVGMPVANRTRSEIEGLIGFFVNTLVLRVDLSGEPDLPAAIALSREAALGAYAHQDLPFERLVEELGLPRDPYRPPLLRVLLQFQNAPGGALELPGLTLAPFPLECVTSRFELVVNLFEAPAGLRAVLTYDADLFEAATIARLCNHFEALLGAWTERPGLSCAELTFLSKAEQHQLVMEWNEGIFTDRSTNRRCLHHRFEEQVDRAPDAVAVSMGSERLTYRELDERSNRLAHHLLVSGVRPGDRVALRLERSPVMVVGILGVLKAGAAYVPLDPAWPAERIAHVLEDSGASFLIDAEPPELARRSGSRPDVAVDPALPAYVIYTSGSTGRPKGVVVSHANVDRLLTATAPWFGFGPSDVWTLFHSYAFDFSVWEIWGALLHGGRLVIVPYWESRSPQDFYRLLQDERVTVLNQTPSAFLQLPWAEDAVLGGAPPRLALRWVIFGGEALDPAILAPWFERHGDERPSLVNMYGITETTVHVTFRPVRRSDVSHGGRRSVIGRPIPDLRAHVLDRHLRPQPLGVPGEIYVGGEGLAQGYLGGPDFTAERFVPDPFSSEPGARLYRSGDLARRLPDGDLEYLGRIDHQVKIRGFRIELGEIEAALASHPNVRESVVLAREDGGGTVRRLVAYAVPASDTSPDPAHLRAFLAGRLPDFMVPSAFVLLDQLPLTVNGKIDRRALPPPEEAGPASRRKHVSPRTDLERYLAGQIREVLGLSEEAEIGVEDDFFELGGNSINGAIFIHRLQDTLREIVHIVTIFDHPTVASLAAYVKEEHPDAVRRIWGEGEERQEAEEAAVGPAEVEEMRRILVSARPDLVAEREELNPPALFLLSPPRSGSTLLRVMLGVHPRLFAPPELELLSFRTLAERSAAFQGRDSFWREGLVRAVMEARQVSAAEAEQVLAGRERQGWTTRRLYRELQGWLGERTLVDKTPSYALDPEVLRQAEAGFAGARYLHLVRHPQATLRSFEEARLDQIFFRRKHPFSRRQLAELVWTVSHRNIVDFLADVPRDRWMRVRFEELVREPQSVLQGICDFLGLEYRPEMAEPYRERAASMVDGPHAVSRMLGDVKFLAHGRVDPAAAERWREAGEVTLGAPARHVAAELGYLKAEPERGVLVPIQAGSPDHRPLFCVHPVGGEVVAYRELARHLPGQTVYGLQSPGRPIEDLRELAALHVTAVRQVQTEGPYRLAGWSMGGVVALEMAGQLAEHGERVELLALIDTLSPVLWAREPEPDEAGLVAAFALDLARLSGMPVPDLDLSGLDGDGALALVLGAGKDAGVLAPGVELRELRRLFERFRANRFAMSSYRPVPYPGEAVLFRARERLATREVDPDLGWKGLVAGLTVREVPGDHYTILREHAEVVAEHLRDGLRRGFATRRWQLLLLSAKTPMALKTSAERLAGFLREHPDIDLADAAHTLQAGQRAFRHRLALVCQDREDALAALESADPRRLLASEQDIADRPVTFLFPGLGEHYPGMALDLYRGEPTFRAALDECCDLLTPHLGLDLRSLLFPEGLSDARGGVEMKDLLGRAGRTASELDRTLYAQPAVFAVEYALAVLLKEWGIRPQSLIGYSLGEYVAACLAGVLSLHDALALVARRARLIDALPAGALLAVPLPEVEVRTLMGGELSVAALNGPSVTVASGPETAIADLERRLDELGVPGRRLPTTHAFHSRMMEPIRGAFADLMASVRLAPPRIPYLSNVTGAWITAAEATDPGYWVRHLCQPVRFADGLAELEREPERLLVEVGPGRGLTALALQSAAGLVAVPTLRSSWERQPDTAFLLTTLAKLWLAGLSVDWAGFYAHERRLRVHDLDAFVHTGFYPPAPPSQPWQALVLSARSEADLERATAEVTELLRAHPETDLGDLACSLQTQGRAFDHRRTLVCRDVEDAIPALEGSAVGRLETVFVRDRDKRVSFLLPGVGDHYPDMALGLYRTEPAFRRIVDDCCERLLPELGFDLRGELFPGLAGSAAPEAPATAPTKRDLQRIVRGDGRDADRPTRPTRPTRMTAAPSAVFVVEYALAQLLMGWGIRPLAMIGYSLGEYTAACLAGVISLADCLHLIARRTRLIEELPAGAMLTVPLPLAEIEPLLHNGLGVAIANGPALHVVSGPVASVHALEAELTQRGVLCRRLSSDQAGHSPMMEPIAGRLRELFTNIELRPPQIPYVSNVTGTWIRPEEATDPEYWVRHLCNRVLFGDGLARLLDSDSVLLEVGPGQSLTAFAKQHPAGGGERAKLMFSTLRSAYNPQPDRPFLLGTLGRLWMAGVPVEWAATHAGTRQRTSTAVESGAGHRERVHVWPNGMQIVAQTQTEAEHFYHDIFEKEIYRRHGIELPDGACIFDVGANIGTFLLYAHQACPGAQIHSFEPAPPLFEKLCRNAALNHVRARLFDFGLAGHEGRATFTFYPLSSGMSSFHADKEQEKEILRLMMEKEREAGVEGVRELMSFADGILEERFRSESFECRLRPLSDVIEECEVEWIDLLKIDVQKAELAVLEGIREEHWPKIGQIVMEVHDLEGRLERILRLLQERGFRVAVEQDELLQGSVLYNLFALREGAGPTESARERQRRAFLRATADRHKPAPRARPVFGVPYVPPTSDLERSLAEVWQRVLKIEEVGIDDNFFDLGGTSLLGLQVSKQIQSGLGFELSPMAIFEAPTVRTLSQSLPSDWREQGRLSPARAQG